MTAIFLEQAFWGFLALTGALIVVIYRLFCGSIQKDLSFLQKDLSSLRDEMGEFKQELRDIKHIDSQNVKEEKEMLKHLIKEIGHFNLRKK